MVGAMIGLAVAALAADCPPQWVPSPNASFRYACHFVTMAKTDSYSNSLRKCVEVCGRDGGVPACFNSVEEQQYVQTLEGYVLDVNSGSWPAWFGLYRDPTGPPIDVSNELDHWDLCVDGELGNGTFAWDMISPRTFGAGSQYGEEYCGALSFFPCGARGDSSMALKDANS